MSGPTTPSPTGSGGPLENGVSSGTERPESAPPAVKDTFQAECETHTPSKEEIETNEKNLQQNASYLGQLVFKLRLLNWLKSTTSRSHSYYFLDTSTIRTL